MPHDQTFKNLILDYPRQALAFLAPSEATDLEQTSIRSLREEQRIARLSDRFFEMDVPLEVSWPDGRREVVLFVVEEETETRRFSIHKLAVYCLQLSEELETHRVVPVVIFLRRGQFPTSLILGTEFTNYLEFRFLYRYLPELEAADYLTSDNLVARLNMLNMRYAAADKLRVYHAAQEGLVMLEPDPEMRLKWADFIEIYCPLSEEEQRRYNDEILSNSSNREVIVGYTSTIREEGRQQSSAANLRRLMEKRFGPLSESVLRRLESASADQLDDWILRVLDAASVEEVFGEPPPGG